MKRTSPRVSESTEAWITSNFSSLNGGSEYILEATAAVAKRMAARIKSVFPDQEMQLMIDCMNGTILSPQIAGQIISLNVSDAIDLDGLDKKWGVGKAEIMGKLESLTLPELMHLEVWCQGFWEQQPNVKLEDYIK